LNGKKTKTDANRSGKNGIRQFKKEEIFNKKSGIFPCKTISLAQGNQ